jgi:hypothetical protein
LRLAPQNERGVFVAGATKMGVACFAADAAKRKGIFVASATKIAVVCFAAGAAKRLPLTHEVHIFQYLLYQEKNRCG